MNATDIVIKLFSISKNTYCFAIKQFKQNKLSQYFNKLPELILLLIKQNSTRYFHLNYYLRSSKGSFTENIMCKLQYQV